MLSPHYCATHLRRRLHIVLLSVRTGKERKEFAMRRIRLFLVAAFAIVCLATTAFSADTKAFANSLKGKATGLKVGITVNDLLSTYIASAAEYEKKLLELMGAEVTLVNCESNANTQSSQVDDFISMGCNVIAIHAADSEALAPAVKKARDAGIIVVGFNKEIGGKNLHFTVTSSDNVATGEKAAQWLLDKAREKGVSNPKIAVMQGTMSQSDAYLRQEGIERAVGKVSGATLLNNPCDWASDKAEKMLSDTLTANPDLFGIVTHCDSMDLGVISALRQARRAVKSDDSKHIYWSGIDCDPVGVSSLQTGLMDTAIEQSPLSLATVIAKGIIQVAKEGKDLKGILIPMDTRVVTEKEADDPALWAKYELDSPELWSRTEEIWNSFLNN